MRAAAAADVDIGFSTSTCLPAAIAASASFSCNGCGVATYTACTSASDNSSSSESVARAMPNLLANGCAKPGKLVTLTIRHRSELRSAVAKSIAIAPVPITPHCKFC